MSATLNQTAAALAQLMQDLTAHGLLFDPPVSDNQNKTPDRDLRMWAFERATACASDLSIHTPQQAIDAARLVEEYVESPSRRLKSAESGLADAHRRLGGDASPIDRLRDLIKQVEYGVLVQHLTPDSLAAERLRGRVKDAVNLFNEVFPSEGHNFSPAGRVATPTVEPMGAGVKPAPGGAA